MTSLSLEYHLPIRKDRLCSKRFPLKEKKLHFQKYPLNESLDRLEVNCEMCLSSCQLSMTIPHCESLSYALKDMTVDALCLQCLKLEGVDKVQKVTQSGQMILT